MCFATACLSNARYLNQYGSNLGCDCNCFFLIVPLSQLPGSDQGCNNQSKWLRLVAKYEKNRMVRKMMVSIMKMAECIYRRKDE